MSKSVGLCDEFPLTLTYQEFLEHGAIVLVLAGEFDLSTAYFVQANGEAALDKLTTLPEGGVLVLNMAAVTFMDSAGMATLADLYQITQRNAANGKKYGKQSRLALCNARGQVRRVLVVTQLDRLMNLFDTKEEDINSILSKT